jgi:hypothetical protein
MLEDPTLSYDPGYAAGATLRRASDVHTETMCDQGLTLRLESWAEAHFARMNAGSLTPQHRQSSREHFRRGFRDGYWARARRREARLEMVA